MLCHLATWHSISDKSAGIRFPKMLVRGLCLGLVIWWCLGGEWVRLGETGKGTVWGAGWIIYLFFKYVDRVNGFDLG